jgi:hypothetical protein
MVRGQLLLIVDGKSQPITPTISIGQSGIAAMHQYRFFRITADDLDELRGQPRHAALLAAFEKWIARTGELDPLIRQIDGAFAGQALGNGIGLFEANGIGFFAMEQELAELRSQEERDDWRRIRAESLNECYCAPTFFDPHGFVFHLPAFLIAELKDQYEYGFIDGLTDRLVDADPEWRDWTRLLTAPQRDAIVATLRLIVDHPEFHDRSGDIELAVRHLAANSGAA